MPTPLAAITALNGFLDRAQPRAALGGRTTDHGLRAAETLYDIRTEDPAPRAADNGRLKHVVLVVSARPDYRALCRELREGHGVECIGAQSCDEVIDWLVRATCDLLLIDGDLPDGPDLCRRMRAEPPAPHVKAILVTPDGSALSPAEAPAVRPTRSARARTTSAMLTHSNGRRPQTKNPRPARDSMIPRATSRS